MSVGHQHGHHDRSHKNFDPDRTPNPSTHCNPNPDSGPYRPIFYD